MDIKLPRIISPNLGCPIILSPQDLRERGVDIVIAEPVVAPLDDYKIIAQPSCKGEGQEFHLLLGDRHELTNPGLPPTFGDVEQTRSLISTTLRSYIFEGKARFVRFATRPVNLADEPVRTKMAVTMFFGVRIGGHEIFKQSFSWGFGRQ